MARRGENWYKLDNAAKIIPSTTLGSDTRVFRLCCELTETVDPDILQRALEQTIRLFPHFHCCLRSGLFWHYLDRSYEKPRVEEEHEPALAALYSRGRKNLLYRVRYFRRRISFGLYHAVSDGAGAFEFFKELIMKYLGMIHDIPEPEERQRASIEQMEKDAFDRFYTRGGGRGTAVGRVMPKALAYQLRGEKDENLDLHLLEGTVSVKAFLALCRAEGTTLAVMTTALMIESIIDEMKMRERRRPIVVTVPVNLRNYFPTETTRNFFGVISVRYDARDYDGTLESILSAVKTSFAEQLREDRIRQTMNTYSALEHNWAVKVIPLQLKDLGIQGLNTLRVQEVTTSVSNVGRIEMPEAFAPYIDHFGAFMATQRAQMVICSYGDRLTFGITSVFVRHGVMMNFFRKLSERGLSVELATNDFDR